MLTNGIETGREGTSNESEARVGIDRFTRRFNRILFALSGLSTLIRAYPRQSFLKLLLTDLLTASEAQILKTRTPPVRFRPLSRATLHPVVKVQWRRWTVGTTRSSGIHRHEAGIKTVV